MKSIKICRKKRSVTFFIGGEYPIIINKNIFRNDRIYQNKVILGSINRGIELTGGYRSSKLYSKTRKLFKIQNYGNTLYLYKYEHEHEHEHEHERERKVPLNIGIKLPEKINGQYYFNNINISAVKSTKNIQLINQDKKIVFELTKESSDVCKIMYDPISGLNKLEMIAIALFYGV